MTAKTKLRSALLAAALILLALAGAFTGCTSGTGEKTDPASGTTAEAPVTEAPDTYAAKVAVLNGTTGFGIAPMYTEFKAGKVPSVASIDFYADATLVSPLVIKGDVDIAAVPTNLASVLYAKTEGKVRVIAVNTLGVLYLIENGSTVNSIADLAGKTVYVPGQGSNPEYLLKALLTSAGMLDKVTIDATYSSPDELTTALASGKASLGVIPEPKVTAALSKNTSLRKALDFTAEWKKTTGTDLVQGCLVARADFVEAHGSVLDGFLAAYADSVKKVTDDPDAAAADIVAAGIVASEAVVKKALPGCNIVCITGEDMKEPLRTFWKSLYDIIPSSVGGAVPDDAVFYVKK